MKENIINNSNILIHIGYHKTASSWLQQEFFENSVTGFNSVAKYDDRAKWVTEFIKPYYLYDKDKVAEYFKKYYEEDKINVLSLERLSGYPSTGGFDSLEIAQRLKEIFPNAKILIVVREQFSMIKSHYIEYLKARGTEKLKELITPKRFYVIRNPIFRLDFFKYNHLIKVYDQLFSKDDVMVLPFELLKEQPIKFVRNIINFTHTNKKPESIAHLNFNKKVNKQISLRKAYLNREYSRLFGSNNSLITLTESKFFKIIFTHVYCKLPISFGEKLESEINQTMKNYICSDYYKDNNFLLEERIKHHLQMDLKKYGYY